jgi:glutamyl-tRNA synthetase
LHIGGARTALFNWLFARHHGGQFILRIEDTDQKRTVAGSLEGIMDGLRWLGLDWDEGPDVGGPYGPYIQSQRLAHYRQWAEWLVEQGKAYRCYATPQELERAKEIAEKTGGKVAGYERLHRFLSAEERAKLAAERPEHVIRIKLPLEGKIKVQDAIRGAIEFDYAELSDIVLLKSDGFPTYHLAMAVDDHLMAISHVMRSDEWLPSLPVHQYLYDAFGWQAPVFVHLPVILNPNGKGKLSKRHEAFQDGKLKVLVQVADYIQAGYQPEAVVNWLTNIGWSFGDDREIFPVEETIKRFTLERINPAPSAMPFSKLENINGHYIRAMSPERFKAALRPVLVAAYGEGAVTEEKLAKIAPHLQERVNPLGQAVEMTRFLFGESYVAPTEENLVPKGVEKAVIMAALGDCLQVLEGLPAEGFTAEAMQTPIRALLEKYGLKPIQLFGALRWAVTGQQVSPPLFESMEALGREATLARLRGVLG